MSADERDAGGRPFVQSYQEEGARLAEALERARDRLARLFASQGLDREIAQDILQDVALLAFQKLRTIRNLDAWLVGTAWRLCIMHFRKVKAHQHVDVDFVDPFFLTYAPTQERDQFLREIRRLWPRRHRAVLELLLAGFTHREIAEETGYSPLSIQAIRKRDIKSVR